MRWQAIVLVVLAICVSCTPVPAMPASDELVGVTVVFNEADSSLRGLQSKSIAYDAEVDYAYSLINAKHMFIKKSDLNLLSSNANIKSIQIDMPLEMHLQNSVPLIRADRAHTISVSNEFLMGKGETVCVIDTGVDYAHNDLGGCSSSDFLAGTCAKVIGGYDFCGDMGVCSFASADSDPLDMNGHGTHVAGIIAANGNILGAAPDAKIVALRILNATGDAPAVSYLDRALEWCIKNKTAYNVSVISISLGTNSRYSSACDASFPATASLINLAISNNITVVASTGNNGDYVSIAAPACITNVTAVAATTAGDAIASFSNRNALVDLAAPGVAINSTAPVCDYCMEHSSPNGYKLISGTSQAAPHVVAAALLLQQYSRLALSRAFTPNEIESQLNRTGVAVADSAYSSITYERIDVNAALSELIGLTISVDSPTNITYDHSSIDLNITSNALLLSSALVSIDGGNNITLTNDTEYHYYANNILADGGHSALFYINNTSGFVIVHSVYFMVDTHPPAFFLNFPTNNSLLVPGQLVNISAVDLSNISDFMYDHNGTNISLMYPYLINTTNIAKGRFDMALFANDTNGFANVTQYTFNMSNSPPIARQVLPSSGVLRGNVSVNVTVADVDGLADVQYAYFYYSNTSDNWSLIGMLAGNSDNLYRLAWNTSLVSDGQQYVVRAEVSDGVNITQAYSQYNFTINNVNQAPTVMITSPADGDTLSGTITMAWTAADPDLDSLNYSVYYGNGDGGWQLLAHKTGMDHSWATRDVANGNNYSLKIIATDSAGLTSIDEISSLAVSNTATPSGSTTSTTETTTGLTAGNIKKEALKASNDANVASTLAEHKPGVLSSVTKILDDVKAGNAVAVAIDEVKLPVQSIEFTPSSDSDWASINVQSLAALPADIPPPPGTAYNSLKIWLENVDSVEDAKIAFSVPKEWLSESGFASGAVRLQRYSAGGWQVLDTVLSGDKSDSYEYAATTPGFSIFSITASQQEFLGTGSAVLACGNGICEPGESCIIDCMGLKASPLMIILFTLAAVFFLSAVYYSIKYTKKRR